LKPLLLQAFFRIHHTPAQPSGRPFCLEADRFAFANDSYWNHVKGEAPPVNPEPALMRRYTNHCFVMVRAALQFWKFARFDPTGSALHPEELARRVRRVCWRSVWLPPLPYEKRIVFPGFKNLKEISANSAGLIQDNIGAVWPIYLRVGNFPVCLPVTRRAKARLNEQMLCDLQAGYPTIVWLYNFPSLNINHTVLVYGVKMNGDRVCYECYDPNYADASKELQFDPANRTFTFEPTFYFKGGPVTPRAIYRGFFE
jgi:hypothetical protein